LTIFNDTLALDSFEIAVHDFAFLSELTGTPPPWVMGVGHSAKALGLPQSLEQATPTKDLGENDASVLDLERLTNSLIQKFEELTMIHQFAEQLRIDVDRETICQELVMALSRCIDAPTLAIEIYSDSELDVQPLLIQSGSAREASWLRQIADAAAKRAGESVAIINYPLLDGYTTRRILVVGISRSDYRAGRMIAIRDDEGLEFGSIEANMMRSTSMMLAVHLANQRQYKQLQHTLDGALVALVSALDAKDRYTSGHSTRVAELSLALAKDLKLPPSECEVLRKAALLHDIGKIGVDDSVLRKHGKLTEEEFALIKRHPVIGHEILKAIGPFEPLLPGVLHHHEAWDGTGYPDGLAGDDIPRIAQIIAVADSFDAMTSDRPYRSGMPIEQVLDIFKRGIGVQWAPDVSALLVAQIDTLSKLLHIEKSAAALR
jgi:putative nucleotidyltransferase with HDIG domain